MITTALSEPGHVRTRRLGVRIADSEEGPVLSVVDHMLTVHQRARKKDARGCHALSPHPFDDRDHELERTSSISDAGDAVVQEEARHGLGESRIVGEMDVEIPEARNQVLSAGVHDLGGAHRFVGRLHGGDAPVAHLLRGLDRRTGLQTVHGDSLDMRDGQLGGGPCSGGTRSAS